MHRDLPPPLIPLLSPATNQVCQTTFSRSQENGRLLGKKKETEDEQSLKKRLTLSERSHRAGTFVISPLLCGCCANVSGWCLEYEPIVVFGSVYAGELGPLGIDILCKSMAAEADIINMSVLPGINARLCCYTRRN